MPLVDLFEEDDELDKMLEDINKGVLDDLKLPKILETPLDENLGDFGDDLV